MNVLDDFKIILVGDLHCKSSNIDETKKIFEYISTVAKKHSIKDVFLLGDLFDSHGIVHLPVVYCYKEIFETYSDLNFFCLVGNHDYIVHGNRRHHSLLYYKKQSNVTIIDSSDNNLFLYKNNSIDFECMPHTNKEDFFELIKKKKTDILLCHHTFLGAQYENSFIAPDGIDSTCIDYLKIVSGHIHKTQNVQQVFYTGTPRWLSKSDANQSKGIWLWDGLEKFKFLSTGTVCKEIFSINIDESFNFDLAIDAKNKYILNVKGDKSFLEKVCNIYKEGCEIRHIPIDSKKITVKESDGLEKSLENFVKNNYVPSYNIDNQELCNIIAQRLNNEK